MPSSTWWGGTQRPKRCRSVLRCRKRRITTHVAPRRHRRGHDGPMILVPRQLRRSDFPSSVPYYGGRLTPQTIAGIERRPPPPTAPPPDDQERQLATLEDLRTSG